KCQLEVVHDVENNNVVALGLQRFQPRNDVVRLVIQVGNKDDDTAASEVFGQESKRLAKLGLLARLNAIDFGKNREELAAPAAGLRIASRTACRTAKRRSNRCAGFRPPAGIRDTRRSPR